MRLDTIDQALVRLLRADGRRSNASLAQEVGLSPSACLRRIKLLEDQGVIRGYTAIVDGAYDLSGVLAIVRISLERQTEAYFTRFENAVRSHPEILECLLMSGDFDYLLKVVVASAADYEAFHVRALSRLPGVIRLQTCLAIRDAFRSRANGGRIAASGASLPFNL